MGIGSAIILKVIIITITIIIIVVVVFVVLVISTTHPIFSISCAHAHTHAHAHAAYVDHEEREDLQSHPCAARTFSSELVGSMICTSKRAETCIEVLPCSGPRLSRQVLHMSKYVVINALTHLSLAYGSLCGE